MSLQASPVHFETAYTACKPESCWQGQALPTSVHHSRLHHCIHFRHCPNRAIPRIHITSSQPVFLWKRQEQRQDHSTGRIYPEHCHFFSNPSRIGLFPNMKLLLIATLATLALGVPHGQQVLLQNGHEASPPSVTQSVDKASESVSSPPSNSIWDQFWGLLHTKKSSETQSCFCAGGSVCCNTVEGLNCNYGLCGI